MAKKKTKAFTVVLLMSTVALLLATSMPAVYATPPTTISGKWGNTGLTLIDEKEAGRNEIYQGKGKGFFLGDISGPFTSVAHITIHNYGLTDQWANMHVVITISPANVKGNIGTLVFMFNGVMGGDGTWVIVSGTDGLTNLHGQGTFSSISPTPPQIAYEGQIHFDP